MRLPWFLSLVKFHPVRVVSFHPASTMQGIIRYLYPTLNQREQEDLQNVAAAIKSNIQEFAL